MFRKSKRARTSPKAETSPKVGADPKVETSARVGASATPTVTEPDVEDGKTTEEATAEGPDETDIAEFTTLSKQLEEELRSIVVGQEHVIRELLLALLAGGHVLLEGVPGLGKTLLVRTLADVFALKFARIQFTPDLMPADIVGTTIVTEQTDIHNTSDDNRRGNESSLPNTPNDDHLRDRGQGPDRGRTGASPIRPYPTAAPTFLPSLSLPKRVFSFQPGPIFANIVLADEVNRATPKTQSALLEGMQERTVSVGDTTRPLPSPFFVLATQNPLEMEGTYPLPEAQLDRFLLKIMVNFPKAQDLLRIIDTTVGIQTPRAKQIATSEQLSRLIATARAVPVATHIKEYAVRLLLATHPDQEDAPEKVRRSVRYGSSPRGLQAIIMTARVRALLAGRYNVSSEDIRTVAYPALRHRLVLNFDGLADGITAEQLIDIIVEEVETE